MEVTEKVQLLFCTVAAGADWPWSRLQFVENVESPPIIWTKNRDWVLFASSMEINLEIERTRHNQGRSQD